MSSASAMLAASRLAAQQAKTTAPPAAPEPVAPATTPVVEPAPVAAPSAAVAPVSTQRPRRTAPPTTPAQPKAKESVLTPSKLTPVPVSVLKTLTPTQRKALDFLESTPEAHTDADTSLSFLQGPLDAATTGQRGILRETMTQDTKETKDQADTKKAVAVASTLGKFVATRPVYTPPGGRNTEDVEGTRVNQQAARDAGAAALLKDTQDMARVTDAPPGALNAALAEGNKTDPGMAAARKLAEGLRNGAAGDKKSSNAKFIVARSTEILNRMQEAAGGPDAVRSGPRYDAMEKAAKQEALDELVKLSTAGQWVWPVGPEDLDPVESAKPNVRNFVRAVLPQEALDAGGNTARTESLPAWFMNVAIGGADYGLTTVLEQAGLSPELDPEKRLEQINKEGPEGLVEQRGFMTNLLANVAGRKDPLTARIEMDPQMQADLSSGDATRVSSALATMSPYLALMFLNPDTVSTALAPVKAMKVTRQVVQRSGDIAEALKAASTAEKVSIINNLGAHLEKADEAARAAKLDADVARRAHAAITPYREGAGTVEDVAQHVEQMPRASQAPFGVLPSTNAKAVGARIVDALPTQVGDSLSTAPGKAVAMRLRDDLARGLSFDPEVAAYLENVGYTGGPLRPESLPSVAYGPEQEAALTQIEDDIDLLKKQRATFTKDFNEARGLEAATEGENRKIPEVVEIDKQLKAKHAEAAKLDALAAAKRGEEKFPAYYQSVSDKVIDDLESQANGEVVPERAASWYTGSVGRPVQEPPAGIHEVDDAVSSSLAPGVSTRQAARIAEAAKNGDVDALLAATSHLEDDAKDAVAQRLGLPDYKTLRELAKHDPGEHAATLSELLAKIGDQNVKLREAQDYEAALRMSPEQAQLYAEAKKEIARAEAAHKQATKELEAASAVDISGRAKVRALDQKHADAAALERARIDDLEAKARALEDAIRNGDDRLVAESLKKLQRSERWVDYTRQDTKVRVAERPTTFERARDAHADVDRLEAERPLSTVPGAFQTHNDLVKERIALEELHASKGAKGKAGKVKAAEAQYAKTQASYDALVGPARRTADEEAAVWDWKLARVHEELVKRKAEHQAKVLAHEGVLIQAEQRRKLGVAANEPSIVQRVKADAAARRVEEAREALEQAEEARAAERAALVQKQLRGEKTQNGAYTAAQLRYNDAEKKLAAAQAAYGSVGKPSVKPPEGMLGAERVTQAGAKVQEAQKKLDELRAAAAQIGREPAEYADLKQALADRSTEWSDLSERMKARDEWRREQRVIANSQPPVNVDPVVFGTRDRSDLAAEFSLIDRQHRREAARHSGLRFAEIVAQNIRSLYRAYGDEQEASLAALQREMGRQLEGEINDIGARLARAAANAVSGTDAPHMRALDAVADEVEHFRNGVRTGQMQGEYVGMVATSPLHPSVPLDRAASKRLVAVVQTWANGDGDLLELRNAVRKSVHEDVKIVDPNQLREPQQADISLAQAVGYGGATRRVLVENGAGLVDAEGARAANAWLNQPAFNNGGGNALASRGRQVVIRTLLDPDDYRPAERLARPGYRGLPDTTAKPMVPVLGRTKAVPKGVEATADAYAEAVNAVDQQIADIDALLASGAYVPRALRDTVAKHVEAAVATGRLTESSGNGDAFWKYWRSSVVAGTGINKPGQIAMDFIGDVVLTGTEERKVAGGLPPLQAAKVFKNAAPITAAVMVPGVAQVAQLSDWLRGVDAGTSIADFDRVVARASLGNPDISRIIDRTNDLVGKTGMTGKQIGTIFQREGVFENFMTQQLSRTVSTHTGKAMKGVLAATNAAAVGGATLVLGGWEAGAVAALGTFIWGVSTERGAHFLQANQDALVDCIRVAADRRRVAVAVARMEAGMGPVEAARSAVKTVGDFSRELHPSERNTIARWWPFWTYRKFMTRSVLRRLSNPYWMKFGMEAERGAELVGQGVVDVTWGNSDEYGFWSEDMGLEPDPTEIEKVRAAIRAEHPEWTGAEGDAQILLAADAYDREHPNVIPRAIVAYDRLKAKLDAMPYPEALRYVQNGGTYNPDGTLNPDADVVALTGPYWAPDPVKSALPTWLQGRYVLYMRKARNQEMQAYYRAGMGRKERAGDEERYVVFPSDQNADGAAIPLLAMALGLAPLGGGSSTAGKDLFSIVMREPSMQATVEAAGMVNPDGTQDTPIPARVARNLLQMPFGICDGCVHVRGPLGEGIDPRNVDANAKDVTFYIPHEKATYLWLLPVITKGVLGGIDAATAMEELSGSTGRDHGRPDAVDVGGAYAKFWSGTVGTVRYSSPSTTAMQESIQAQKRVVEAMPSGATPEVPDSATTAERDWTRFPEMADFPEKSRAAVALAKKAASTPPEKLGELTPVLERALPYMRATLAKPVGPYTALQVAKMTPGQVIEATAGLSE